MKKKSPAKCPRHNPKLPSKTACIIMSGLCIHGLPTDVGDFCFSFRFRGGTGSLMWSLPNLPLPPLITHAVSMTQRPVSRLTSERHGTPHPRMAKDSWKYDLQRLDTQAQCPRHAVPCFASHARHSIASTMDQWEPDISKFWLVGWLAVPLALWLAGWLAGGRQV